MRKIQWQVIIQDNKIISMENAVGFPQNEVESHLLIIGVLENLKESHKKKLETLYENTKKADD